MKKLQRYVYNSTYICILMGICSVFFIYGCVSLKETGRGFLGVSTKILEQTRDEALQKEFAIDEVACYARAEEILKAIGAYIYAKKPKMLAIYVSDQDTTPVGIFIESQGVSTSKIGVSSPSTDAKEYIAMRLFKRLDRFLNPQLEEGLSDE